MRPACGAKNLASQAVLRFHDERRGLRPRQADDQDRDAAPGVEDLDPLERRSITVTHLSVDQVSQFFRIRLQLELLATEWALENLQDDDVEEIRQILDRMDQPGVSVGEWRRLNQDFQCRFYDCARSEHLLDLIRRVWDKVEHLNAPAKPA